MENKKDIDNIYLYLAPMEGITTYAYRRAYEHHFGNIDRYFTPFIANKKMGKRDRDGILPENNSAKELIPQILTNSTEDFLAICRALAPYGYKKVNLNLGCPSATVVGKKRGAGFLGEKERLEQFLEEVFEKSSMEISLKTRIGVNEEDEWEELLAVYEKFPLEELIVHPRLRCDFYKGEIRFHAFEKAIKRIKVPLCYNGEINSLEDYLRVKERFPTITRFMIGRGILRYPGLTEEIVSWEKERNQGKEISSYRESKTDREELLKRTRDFHDEILEEYKKIMSGDLNTLFKMKELWCYLGESFPGKEKSLKKIRKTNSLREYEIEVNNIFRD